MKAVILAAGMGTRLGKYTENVPKCMLRFKGKPLIQWQVETLRASGINYADMVIVGGYNVEKVAFEGIEAVKILVNKEYATTNMVATLMVAKDEILKSKDGILVCYGDIIYEKRLVEEMKKFKGDVGVLADDCWIDYWKSRLDNWQDDVESFEFNRNDEIVELGTPKCNIKNAMARYVGMIRFSKKGAMTLVGAYEKNRAHYWDKSTPWLKSKSFRNAYMTCMLQAIINEGNTVKVVHTCKGWMEFDTTEDYEKATKWAAEGTLSRFIKI